MWNLAKWSNYALISSVALVVYQSAVAQDSSNLLQITGVKAQKTGDVVEIIVQTPNEGFECKEQGSHPCQIKPPRFIENNKKNEISIEIQNVFTDTPLEPPPPKNQDDDPPPINPIVQEFMDSIKLLEIEGIEGTIRSHFDRPNTIVIYVIIPDDSEWSIKRPKASNNFALFLQKNGLVDPEISPETDPVTNPVTANADIIGTWISENDSLQPFVLNFKEDRELIIFYRLPSGHVRRPKSYEIGEKTGEYQKIDLIMGPGRTIETIYQIKNDNDGNRELHIELGGREPGKPRPSNFTQDGLRIFGLVKEQRLERIFF